MERFNEFSSDQMENEPTWIIIRTIILCVHKHLSVDAVEKLVMKITTVDGEDKPTEGPIFEALEKLKSNEIDVHHLLETILDCSNLLML